jgi:hypothetical protein
MAFSLGTPVRPDYGQPGDVVAGVHNAGIRAMGLDTLKLAVDHNGLVEWVADGGSKAKPAEQCHKAVKSTKCNPQQAHGKDGKEATEDKSVAPVKVWRSMLSLLINYY